MAEGMQTEGQYHCGSCGEGLNIIGVIEHASDGCDPVLQASDLSQGERATLMYVESRVVDHGGELDLEQMNYQDQQNLKLFGAAGILDVDERHPAVDHGGMDVVKFTDAAWDLTRDCRQMRAAQDMDPDVVDFDPPEEDEPN
jgi:hypothetical protein